MNKRKKEPRVFFFLALALGFIALTMLVRFPKKEVSLENQRAQLAQAASAYYDAQTLNNQLNTVLSEVNTRDFIERTARRDHGYCWYGEIVYEVGNLDAVTAQTQGFEIYADN